MKKKILILICGCRMNMRTKEVRSCSGHINHGGGFSGRYPDPRKKNEPCTDCGAMAKLVAFGYGHLCSGCFEKRKIQSREAYQ